MITCIVVASGWSLRNPVDQVPMIEAARAAGKAHVIVINNNWELLPDADVLYAADPNWWDRYAAEVAAGFRGECWTALPDTARRHDLCRVETVDAPGLSLDPLRVHSGNNGGYQAIGLAYNFGARRIILCGYDMQRGPHGEKHHHPDHPAPMGNSDGLKDWIEYFNALAFDLAHEGADCVNCSPRTALTQFRRADLAETLAALTQ